MRVAVLGLGRMGTEIARRLEGGEHELTVWNRSSGAAAEFGQRGVPVAESPRAAMEWADACVTMLADSAAAASVATGPDGLLSAELDERPRTWIEMSTLGVADSAELAAATAEAGVDYVRAPVSGNPGVVAAGNATIVSSGPAEAFERVRGLLEAIGPTIFHVGEGEEARAMKLALNLILAGTTQLLAEALVMGEANGLGRAQMLEVINGSVVGSPFTVYKSQPLIDDDYASTFTTRLMAKDLDLIIECANGARVPVPVAGLVRQIMQSGIAAGMGDLDFSALVPLLRRQAGLPDGPGNAVSASR
jgi:3-hydroxyisobutyrate dehydrogenase-like beta-hydroxyacid dehydrogenase